MAEPNHVPNLLFIQVGEVNDPESILTVSSTGYKTVSGYICTNCFASNLTLGICIHCGLDAVVSHLPEEHPQTRLEQIRARASHFDTATYTNDWRDLHWLLDIAALAAEEKKPDG